MEDSFLDTRWRPFETSASAGSAIVKVDSWKGPAYFFDRLREVWKDTPSSDRWGVFPLPQSADEYAASVNMWLAIVDAFGLNAPYTQHFLGLVRHVALEILVSAYRKDPSEGPIDHKRYFNGRVYERQEFQQEFNQFIIKHRLLF